MAVGNQAQSSGANATSLGNLAHATGDNSTALGNSAVASAANSTAVGQNAKATFAGSTAIGAGATTTAANQVSLGGTGSSVRIGDIGASTAAQQASSANLATIDANGVVGRSNINIAAIGTLQGQVGSLFDLADRNRQDIREADEGVAMALALDTPSIPAGAHFAVSGGVGYFKHRAALATALAAAVSETASVSAGVTYGIDSNNVGARAGFQFAF